MWMWHRRLKRDVFVVKVEERRRDLRYTWVYWFSDKCTMEGTQGWNYSYLSDFEPPHEH